MPRKRLARVVRMDASEIAWRARAAARTTIDRLGSRAFSTRWRRRDLLRALKPLPELRDARAALAAGRWADAHRSLSRHFSTAQQRFVISPSIRAALVERVRAEFPDSPRDAAIRAERIASGQYDLLGFRGLRWGGQGRSIDWHFDPVHDRRAPQRFWADVPYLDPQCGDHKVIWELNRHQHWLALGRAFWLTGIERYRSECLTQLEDWLHQNPPLSGINWASMLELGFRSLSWIWALQFFVEPALDDAAPW